MSALRDRNRAQVVAVLRQAGTASRADIARVTGLSRTTVSSLVGELELAGFVASVKDDAPSGTGRGRPGVRLALQPAAGAVLGIDFGHTHIRVAVADLSSRVLAERHRALDVDHAADAALETATKLAEEVLTEGSVDRAQIVGVGVGLPGPLDRLTGTVGSSVILPGWAGLRPTEELGRRLRLPIAVDNDANLGALAEFTLGAGRAATDIVYLKLSSGIGAGLVLGGLLHRGATGIAGELGHVLSTTEGRVCRCGNRGCLETVAAAPALLELLRVSHGELTLPDLLRLAEEGDVGVRRVFGDAGRSIGRALADLVNAVNPELVVVGGDLSAVGEPLLDGIRASLERYALPAANAAVEVVPGVLGERAEVLGAVALVATDTERVDSSGLAAV
jgi:predicted NBD/HSP70 family sugar kinase